MYTDIRSGRGNMQVRTRKSTAIILDKFQRDFMESGKLPLETETNDRTIQTMRMPSGNTDFMEVQYAYAARKFDNNAIDISKWLLIGYSAIYFAFDKLNIPYSEYKPPFTEKQLRKAIQKDGMSEAKAAKYFKCAPATIVKYKRKWDIYNKGILNRREMCFLIEKWWYGDGLTPADIKTKLAKHFSVPLYKIYRDIIKLKRAGIIDQDF